MASLPRRRQSPTNPSGKILESGRGGQLDDAGIFLGEDASMPSRCETGTSADEGSPARISRSSNGGASAMASARIASLLTGDNLPGASADTQAKADIFPDLPSRLKFPCSTAADVIVPPHERTAEDQPPPNDDSLETNAFEIGVATDDELRPLVASIDINSPVTGKIEDWTLVAVRNSGFPAPIIHLVGQYMGQRIRKTSAVTVIGADFRTVRTMNSVYELGEKAADPFTALLAVLLMGNLHAPRGELQIGEHSFGGGRSWMI